MNENELPSLEYIEDPYIDPKLKNCVTPSLDADYDNDDDEYEILNNWSDETELYLRSLTLDDILIDNNGNDNFEYQKVETEFLRHNNKYNNNLNNNNNNNNDARLSIAKRWRLKLFNTRKSIHDVKVTFIDFSKPYIAKISSNDNYKKFLNMGNSLDQTQKMSEPSSPASVASADIAAEFAALTTEEQERQSTEWTQELARVEEEINTLRTVLASKTRHASDLKRKLGITVWKEVTDDLSHGIKNVKESTVYQNVEHKVGDITKAITDAPIYQKTESVIKSTAETTKSLFGGITSNISSRFSQMKNSESMRSIEAGVGNAFENVKTRVTSRSGSVSSFNDALNENHTVTSPTIAEEKPIA